MGPGLASSPSTRPAGLTEALVPQILWGSAGRVQAWLRSPAGREVSFVLWSPSHGWGLCLGPPCSCPGLQTLRPREVSTAHHWSSGPPGLCSFCSTIFLTPKPTTLGPERGVPCGLSGGHGQPAGGSAPRPPHSVRVLVECPEILSIGFCPPMLRSGPSYLDQRTWALQEGARACHRPSPEWGCQEGASGGQH